MAILRPLVEIEEETMRHLQEKIIDNLEISRLVEEKRCLKKALSEALPSCYSSDYSSKDRKPSSAQHKRRYFWKKKPSKALFDKCQRLGMTGKQRVFSK